MSGSRFSPLPAPDTSRIVARARECDVADLPALLGELEVARATALSRLLSTPAAAPAAPARLLFDAAEMSSQVGVPESWLRARARAGEIRSVKCGHYTRFDPIEVLEDLKRLRVTRAPKKTRPRDNRDCEGEKRQQRRGAATALLPDSAPGNSTPEVSRG